MALDCAISGCHKPQGTVCT